MPALQSAAPRRRTSFTRKAPVALGTASGKPGTMTQIPGVLRRKVSEHRHRPDAAGRGGSRRKPAGGDERCDEQLDHADNVGSAPRAGQRIKPGEKWAVAHERLDSGRFHSGEFERAEEHENSHESVAQHCTARDVQGRRERRWIEPGVGCGRSFDRVGEEIGRERVGQCFFPTDRRNASSLRRHDCL